MACCTALRYPTSSRSTAVGWVQARWCARACGSAGRSPRSSGRRRGRACARHWHSRDKKSSLQPD
eukprot:scaffold215543_cov39-Tisochrysis_lutea.AAC.2